MPTWPTRVKPRGKDHVLPGPYTLFHVGCPEHGLALGRVKFASGQRVVVCVECGAEALEAWQHGCGGV